MTLQTFNKFFTWSEIKHYTEEDKPYTDYIKGDIAMMGCITGAYVVIIRVLDAQWFRNIYKIPYFITCCGRCSKKVREQREKKRLKSQESLLSQQSLIMPSLNDNDLPTVTLLSKDSRVSGAILEERYLDKDTDSLCPVSKITKQSFNSTDSLILDNISFRIQKGDVIGSVSLNEF